MSKVDANYLDIKAGTSFVKIDAETAYQFAKGQINWQDVTATEIFLDPNTLNQYIRDGEVFTFSDLASVEVQKGITDSLAGFTDSQILEVQKGLSDTLSFSETVDILLIIVRDFADSFAVSDLAVLTIEKPVADSVSLTDLVTTAFDSGKADTFSLADASAVDVTKPVTDTVSLSDVFSKVVTYSRIFADSFSVDDQATVDAISKQTDSTKTNVFSLTDISTLSFDKEVADSFSFAESQVFPVDKSLTDSFSFSESVTVTILGGSSSVLNASALNTFTFNS